ncbi:uncharacterized protein RBU33_006128 [Hipposideros larvatus]
MFSGSLTGGRLRPRRPPGGRFGWMLETGRAALRCRGRSGRRLMDRVRVCLTGPPPSGDPRRPRPFSMGSPFGMSKSEKMGWQTHCRVSKLGAASHPEVAS